MSISPTFYVRLFCTEVLRAAFFTFILGLYFFSAQEYWRKSRTLNVGENDFCWLRRRLKKWITHQQRFCLENDGKGRKRKVRFLHLVASYEFFMFLVFLHVSGRLQSWLVTWRGLTSYNKAFWLHTYKSLKQFVLDLLLLFFYYWLYLQKCYFSLTIFSSC